MESKLPPPPGRVFGGPPPAPGRAEPQPRAFARRESPPPPPGRPSAPPTAFNGGSTVGRGGASASATFAAPASGFAHGGPPQMQSQPQPQVTNSPFSSPAVSRPKDLWRPGRRGGRHDSPLYAQQRKRPSMDSNVSWSGSEVESVHTTTATATVTSSTQSQGQQEAHTEGSSSASPWVASAFPSEEEEEGAGWGDIADASTLFASPSHAQASPPVPAETTAPPPQPKPEQPKEHVDPPKTPKSDSTYSTFEESGGLTASQRVRMGISNRAGSRANSSEGLGLSARAGSRANSTEDFSEPAAYDEEKNGPRSCPPDFSDKQPHFSLDKLRAMRSNELVASKLLPTRSSVNSLMGYVRELQLSEASLRKQLVKTKKHTETELSQSLSKVSELERSMQEVERDRELARRKLEEQEQLIRDLAAKLKQAEMKKSPTKTGAGASGVEELPSIAEETTSHVETSAPVAAVDGEQQQQTEEKVETAQEPLQEEVPVPSPPVQPPARSAVANLNPEQIQGGERPEQYAIASPRSPNKPLWDPWASGGVTPMKHLPPMFTIGAPAMDLMSSSSGPQEASDNSSTPAVAGEYELKSVLPSPRRSQLDQPPVQAQLQDAEGQGPQQWGQEEGYDASSFPTAQPQSSGMFSPQYPAPIFNVGAMPPSPPYEQQPPSFPVQDAVYDAPTQADVQQENVPSPSQMPPPTFAVGGAVPVDEGAPYQQDPPAPPMQETSPFQQEMAPSAVEGTAPYQEEPVNTDTTQLSSLQAQKESQELPSPAFEPPQMANNSQEVEGPAAAVAYEQEQSPLPPPPMMTQAPTGQDNAQESGAPAPIIEESITAVAGGPPTGPPGGGPPPPGASPPKAFSSTSRGKTPPKTKGQGESNASLETLLIDFFTEVDKKRLSMAKVYGKRYAGREKWLFAELTKRYGAGKVAGLKEQFESGSSSKPAAVESPAASEPTKPHRQGHPRHPQFFNPAPAVGMDSSTTMGSVMPPPSLAQETAGTMQNQETPKGEPSPARQEERVSPRRSGGDMSTFGRPQPFQPPQPEAEGTDDTKSSPPAINAQPPVGSAPLMNGPPMMQRREMNGQNGQQPPPMGPPGAGAAPMGLRQRNPNAKLGQQSQQPATADTQAASVTLEGLLKDLYRKHQPDKLKNVSLVAKEYAGKERELVGLLKGKYGALSVKELEENLEVLERASRALKCGGKKKRGCFLSSISLMFWLTVLSAVAVGSILLSVAVLDAQECHAIEGAEDSSDDPTTQCSSLKKELNNFTYERVGDYVRQPHSESCFCAEWNQREDALLTTFSPEDLVDLARLLPFSPDGFGAPWIEAVKEQVPSQEFYEGYAKPVVDLSLDAGVFIWSSLSEIGGSVMEMITDEKASTTASVSVESDEVGTPEEEPENEVHEPDTAVEDTERFMEENESVEFEASEEQDVEVNAAVDEIPEPDVSVEEIVEMGVAVESEGSVDGQAAEEEYESADAAVADEVEATDVEVDVSMEGAIEVEASADETEVGAIADESEDVEVVAEEIEAVSKDSEVEVAADKDEAAEMAAEMAAGDEEIIAEEVAAVEVETFVEEDMEAEVPATTKDDDVVAPTSDKDDTAADPEASSNSKDRATDASVEDDETTVEPEVSSESKDDATNASAEDTLSENHDDDEKAVTSNESEEETETNVVEVEVRQEGFDLSYPETSSEDNDGSVDGSETISQNNIESPEVDDDRASTAEEVVADSPAPTEKAEVGGLASSVNEVLARLVEPFSSRKVVPAEEETSIEEASTEEVSTEEAVPVSTTNEEEDGSTHADDTQEEAVERELEEVAAKNERLADDAVDANKEDIDLAGEEAATKDSDVDSVTVDEPVEESTPAHEAEDDEAASVSVDNDAESIEALEVSEEVDESLHFAAGDSEQAVEEVSIDSADASEVEEEKELNQGAAQVVEEEEIEPMLEDAPEIDNAEMSGDDSVSHEVEEAVVEVIESSEILSTDDDTEATPDSDEGMPAFDGEAVHDDGDVEDASTPTTPTTEEELEAEFLAASNEEVVPDVQEEAVMDEQETEEELDFAVDQEAEAATEVEASKSADEGNEAPMGGALREDGEGDEEVSTEELVGAEFEVEVEESEDGEEIAEAGASAETGVPTEAASELENGESVEIETDAEAATETEPEVDAPVETESESAIEAAAEVEAEVETDGDEEALFMDDLEDPEEVLRMAEQAAAAEL